MPVLYPPELSLALVVGWALLNFLPLCMRLAHQVGLQFRGVTAEGWQSLRSRPGFQSKVVRVLHVAIFFTDMFLLVWQGSLVDQKQEFSISFTKNFVVKNHWVSPKGAGCPGGSCLGTLGWMSIAILCGGGESEGLLLQRLYSQSSKWNQ